MILLQKNQNNNINIINKSGHFFNRIHVDDLCEILYQSIKKPDPGEVFNISDYTPSTSEEFINEATKILNMPKNQNTKYKKNTDGIRACYQE